MKIQFMILFIFLSSSLFTKSININEQKQVVDISDLIQEKDDISKTLNKLRAENAYFLMLTFVDILGNLKEIVIPIEQAEEALKFGLTFDSSSIAGYNEIKKSDMLIKPDLSTLRFLPWLDETQKTAWLMCNVFKNKTDVYEGDPRLILQKTCKELADLGYQLNVGVELEFFMLENDQIMSPCDDKKYFDSELTYSRQQENHILLHGLKGLNIQAEKIHHEVACGQHEISIKYGDALTIADQITIAKYALKVMGKQMNYIITFMPKPMAGQNGSGMHVHYSLFSPVKKRNIFYSENDQNKLSQTAKNFLAGNMAHIKKLAPLFNPTINSYKRLRPGFEAPVFICWDTLNRSSMFRIPLIHNNEETGMRIELRCPDSTCNPYLALAALIKSGIEGIKQEMQLPPAVEQNLFKLTIDEVKQLNINTYPTNLPNALDKFEKSTLAKELLGNKAHAEFLKLKRKECIEFNTEVTDWELKRYL